jgi:hypothetical protein
VSWNVRGAAMQDERTAHDERWVRRLPGRDLSPTQRTVNRALSAVRAPVERGVARLKSWRIFHYARCSPNRMSSIAAAVLTLERQR